MAKADSGARTGGVDGSVCGCEGIGAGDGEAESHRSRGAYRAEIARCQIAVLHKKLPCGFNPFFGWVVAVCHRQDDIALIVNDIEPVTLGRSMQHLITLLYTLKRHELDCVSLKDSGIDTTTATGTLMLQILVAFSAYARKIIREQTRSGLARARTTGAAVTRLQLEGWLATVDSPSEDNHPRWGESTGPIMTIIRRWSACSPSSGALV